MKVTDKTPTRTPLEMTIEASHLLGEALSMQCFKTEHPREFLAAANEALVAARELAAEIGAENYPFHQES